MIYFILYYMYGSTEHIKFLMTQDVPCKRSWVGWLIVLGLEAL